MNEWIYFIIDWNIIIEKIIYLYNIKCLIGFGELLAIP